MPLFLETNFDFTDDYKTMLNQVQLDFGPNGGMVDTFPETCAQAGNVLDQETVDRWTKAFRTIHTFTKYYVQNNVEFILDKDQRAAFMKCWTDTKDEIQAYVNANKDRVRKLTNAQWSVYSYLNNVLKDMEDLKPAIESLNNGLLRCVEFSDEFDSEKEDTLRKKQFERIGWFGHQPSIEECVHMDPEKMSAEDLADRMLWLTNKGMLESRLGDINDQNNIYFYTVIKISQKILRMPFDKQVEYAICLSRQRQALWNLADAKYQELLAKIPENFIFENPEYEHLTFKAMEKMPEYKQVVDEVEEQLKPFEISELERLKAISEKGLEECENIISVSTEQSNDILKALPAYQTEWNRVKEENADKSEEELEQLALEQLKTKEKGNPRLIHLKAQIDIAKKRREELKNYKYAASDNVSKRREMMLMEIFKKSPDFKKIQIRISREHYAKMQLAGTKEYMANEACQELIRSSIGSANRIAKVFADLLYENPKAKAKQVKMPGYDRIGHLLVGDMEGLKRDFGHSGTKKIKETLKRCENQEQQIARQMKEETESGLYHDQHAMSESYYQIANDTGKASIQFKELKEALAAVFSYTATGPKDEVGLTEYFKAVTHAKKKISAYLNRHKGLLIDKRRDRVELVTDLASKMNTLLADVKERVEETRLTEPQTELKRILDLLQNPELRPANPAMVLKETFGRILFWNLRDKKNAIADPDAENAALHKFINSNAFQSVFNRQTITSLRYFTEEDISIHNPLTRNVFMEKLKQIYDSYKKNQALNLFGNAETNRLLNIAFINDAVAQNDRYFDPWKEENDEILDVRENKNRLGLFEMDHDYNMLALGAMLLRGNTLDQAFDPFAFDTERKAAGHEILEANRTLNNEEFEKFCAERLFTVMNASVNYINEKMQAMGEFSVKKLQNPEFMGLCQAVEVLQRTLAVLSKQHMTAGMENLEKENPEKYKGYKTLEEKAGILSGVLYPVIEGTKKSLVNAAKYDIRIKNNPKPKDVENILKDIFSVRHAEKLIRQFQNKTKDHDFLQLIEENGKFIANRILQDQKVIKTMNTDFLNLLMAQPGALSNAAQQILSDELSANADVFIGWYREVNPRTKAWELKVEQDSVKINKEMLEALQHSVVRAKGDAEHLGIDHKYKTEFKTAGKNLIAEV